jgi:hypothetical protein
MEEAEDTAEEVLKASEEEEEICKPECNSRKRTLKICLEQCPAKRKDKP